MCSSALLRICTLAMLLSLLTACGGGGGGVTSVQPPSTPGSLGTPVITSLSPNPVNPGGPDFVLSVYGANFSATQSVVRWNGQERPTGLKCVGFECVSQPAHIDAMIGSGDIRTAGTAQITVGNPGGSNSNALTLTIGTVPPQQCSVCITEMVPDTITAGSQGFTLTINGSGFFPGMTVLWDDTTNPTSDFRRPTTYVSYNQLTATIPASDIRTPSSVYVSVTDPMSPLFSAPSVFTIKSPF